MNLQYLLAFFSAINWTSIIFLLGLSSVVVACFMIGTITGLFALGGALIVTALILALEDGMKTKGGE